MKEFLIVSRQEYLHLFFASNSLPSTSLLFIILLRHLITRRYLLEQEARNAEEEAVRQAMRLSLLDIAKAK